MCLVFQKCHKGYSHETWRWVYEYRSSHSYSDTHKYRPLSSSLMCFMVYVSVPRSSVPRAVKGSVLYHLYFLTGRSGVLLQVRVTFVPSCMSPGGQMDTDVCGASVWERTLHVWLHVSLIWYVWHMKNKSVLPFTKDTQDWQTWTIVGCIHTHTHTHMHLHLHLHLVI